MSGAEDGAGHRDGEEIIIVRRNRGGEGEHHSSAWKIAFADFMTAMMALFLVLWLTNSTSEATQEQVAQYFNPIKLADPATARRGLHDASASGHSSKMEETKGPSEVEGGSGGHPRDGEAEEGGERALFQDPYAVLAEIAAEASGGEAVSENATGSAEGRPGLNGGDAYRDPFDPQSWQLQPNARAASNEARTVPAEFETAVEPAGAAEPVEPAGDEPNLEETPAVDADPTGRDPANRDAAERTAGSGEPAEPKAENEPASDPETERLRRELAEALGGPAGLKVEAGEGGTAISLAEGIDGAMFELGSARPTPEAVTVMEKVAAVLNERPGRIVVRGHTDARPFRAGGGDNWQLSSSRAQMAFYMLTRGGLDEARVGRIEGVADRDPQIPDDPTAAANRRIEILLERPDA